MRGGDSLSELPTATAACSPRPLPWEMPSPKLTNPAISAGLCGSCCNRVTARNQYLEQEAPWNPRKDPAQKEKFLSVCTVGLNLSRQVAVYLAPVLPQLAAADGRPVTAAHYQLGRCHGSGDRCSARPLSALGHAGPGRNRYEAMIAESREPEAQELGQRATSVRRQIGHVEQLSAPSATQPSDITAVGSSLLPTMTRH